MRNLEALLLLALIAAPNSARASESRLRLENPGKDGRVEVVLPEEGVRTVEISVPGVISGETVIVEAPAPTVRLKGGSMDGDLLLEAVVNQKLRASRPRGPTVSILPAPRRYQPESRRYLNHTFTDFGIAYGAGYGSWYTTPVATSVRHSCGSSRTSSGRTATHHSSSSSRGTYSSRAMISRR